MAMGDRYPECLAINGRARHLSIPLAFRQPYDDTPLPFQLRHSVRRADDPTTTRCSAGLGGGGLKGHALWLPCAQARVNAEQKVHYRQMHKTGDHRDDPATGEAQMMLTFRSSSLQKFEIMGTDPDGRRSSVTATKVADAFSRERSQIHRSAIGKRLSRPGDPRRDEQVTRVT
ncbi:hypothetical protein [Bradyrhizobium sp. UFLA05-112]